MWFSWTNPSSKTCMIRVCITCMYYVYEPTKNVYELTQAQTSVLHTCLNFDRRCHKERGWDDKHDTTTLEYCSSVQYRGIMAGALQMRAANSTRTRCELARHTMSSNNSSAPCECSTSHFVCSPIIIQYIASSDRCVNGAFAWSYSSGTFALNALHFTGTPKILTTSNHILEHSSHSFSHHSDLICIIFINQAGSL